MRVTRLVIHTDESLTGLIRSYGVRRFARLAKIDSSNLTRSLNNKSNISEGKFNELKKILDKIPVSEFSKNTRSSNTRNSSEHGSTVK